MATGDRALFDMPDDDIRDIVYLNTARVGPRLKAVSAAGTEAIARYASPWLLGGEDWFGAPERLRNLVAGFIGVRPESIAFVPAASYGIALAAKNLPVSAGQSIVLVQEQYPSNVYAWQRVARERAATLLVAERSTAHSLTETLLQLIGPTTAVIAIPNCHWTDGEVIDLDLVAEAARASGSALVVDASQSLGAMPIDFASIRPDFVVAVGYKWLLGPYGLGYCYIDERWQQQGVPLEETWLGRKGSEDFSRLVDYVDEYRPGARRFDFGEFPTFVSIAMATAALEQLDRWGAAYVTAELRRRNARIRQLAAAAGLSPVDEERSAPHITGLRLPDGQRAAQLGAAFRSAGVHVSVRGNIIRISPHLHTDDLDLERFGSALS